MPVAVRHLEFKCLVPYHTLVEYAATNGKVSLEFTGYGYGEYLLAAVGGQTATLNYSQSVLYIVVYDGAFHVTAQTYAGGITHLYDWTVVITWNIGPQQVFG